MFPSPPSFNSAVEDPIPVSDGFEVFVLYPSFAFVGVPSTAPTPYGLKDSAVYALKGFFAYDMSVIITPPPNNGVKFFY